MKLLEEKDTKRSLWWLDENQPGSSIPKIMRWIELADIRYGHKKNIMEESDEDTEPESDQHTKKKPEVNVNFEEELQELSRSQKRRQTVSVDMISKDQKFPQVQPP